MKIVEVLAPAKLTWSLSVGDRREDGYHDLEAEMVSISLFDELSIEEPGDGLSVWASAVSRAEALEVGPENLISRALALVGRTAGVSLTKHIPMGGGLGGGSADAGAILRWAGGVDPAQAAQLGGDVPFCALGGRAMVRGIGERLEELDFVERRVTLLVPPFGVNTAAAYRALDELRNEGRGRHDRNDLTEAAERVMPELALWRAEFERVTGSDVVLAGSGSTLFVEGTRADHGLEGVEELRIAEVGAMLLDAVTVPKEVGEPKGL